MYVKNFTAEERDTWDAFVSNAPAFALLQSWDWGVFKERLGWKAYRIAIEDEGKIVAGAQLLIKSLPFGLSIAYVPRGPVGRWLDEDIASLLMPELIRVADRNRAVFLKIEPSMEEHPALQSVLNKYRFRCSQITNQPKTTILLDISQGQEDILLQMRKKTRQYIHRAGREGITIRTGDSSDLPAYCDLMRLTGKREHFAARSPEYYMTEWEIFRENQQAVLLLAFYQEQLIAVRAIYHFGQYAAEFHGGSLTIPGLHPNYLLVWQAIQWAQAHGCISYDFWGIPDEIGAIFTKGSEPPIVDRMDGLWGVYRFKSGFSKNIVSYAGAYDCILRPPLYGVMTNRLVRGDTADGVMARLDSLKPAW